MERSKLKEKEISSKIAEMKKNHETKIENLKHKRLSNQRDFEEQKEKMKLSQKIELEEVTKKRSEELSNLENRLKTLISEKNGAQHELDAKITDSRNGIEELKRCFAEEVEDLEKLHKSRIDSANEEQEQWRKEFKEKCAERMSKKEMEKQKQNKELLEQHENELSAVRAKWEEKFVVDSNEVKKTILDRISAEKQEIIEENEAIIQSLESEIAELESERCLRQSNLNEQKAKREERIDILKRELTDLELNWERTKTEIEKEKQSLLEQQRNEHLKVEQEVEKGKQKLEDVHLQELNGLKIELCSVTDECNSAIAKLEEELAERKLQNEAELRILNDNLEQIRSSDNEMEQQAREELFQVQRQFQEELAAINKEKDEFMKKAEELLKETKSANSEELEKAAANFKLQSEVYESELRQKAESKQRKISEQALELERIASENNLECSKLRSELEDQVSQARKENQELREMHSQLVLSNRHAMERLLHELNESEEKARLRIEAERHSVESSIRAAETERKERICALQQSIADLNGQLQKRKGKPEDTKRIEELKKSVEEKRGQHEKIGKELRYYRAELINREKTVGRIFNNGKSDRELVLSLQRRMQREQIIAAMNQLDDSSAGKRLPALKRV
jgi:hypothetical protein